MKRPPKECPKCECTTINWVITGIRMNTYIEGKRKTANNHFLPIEHKVKCDKCDWEAEI